MGSIGLCVTPALSVLGQWAACILGSSAGRCSACTPVLYGWAHRVACLCSVGSLAASLGSVLRVLRGSRCVLGAAVLGAARRVLGAISLGSCVASLAAPCSSGQRVGSLGAMSTRGLLRLALFGSSPLFGRLAHSVRIGDLAAGSFACISAASCVALTASGTSACSCALAVGFVASWCIAPRVLLPSAPVS